MTNLWKRMRVHFYKSKNEFVHTPMTLWTAYITVFLEGLRPSNSDFARHGILTHNSLLITHAQFLSCYILPCSSSSCPEFRFAEKNGNSKLLLTDDIFLDYIDSGNGVTGGLRFLQFIFVGIDEQSLFHNVGEKFPGLCH